MDSKIEFQRIRDFGELINDTFSFLKQNFKPLFKSFIYICGFFWIAVMLTTVLQQIRMQEIMQSGNYTAINKKIYEWPFYLSMLFSLTFYNAISVTTFAYISVYIEKGNQPPEVEEVWARFKDFFWRSLGAFIILSALTVIGCIFLIIPGIYLWPVSMVILATITFEDASFGYSFNRGFYLIKNRWWRTFGAIFIMLLIISVASSIFSIPLTIVTTGKLLFGKTPNSTALVAVLAVFQSFAYVFMIIPFILIGLSYFSLAEEKEGAGLLAQVNQIGQVNTDSQHPEEQY